MSSFTESPMLTPLNCGKRWAVRKEFSYEVGHLGSGDKITVPVGFITDLVSTPKPLWSILPPFGRYLSSAIIHDYLYFSHDRNKKESDEIFYEGMIVLGVSKWKANLIYQAVRIFGSSSYKKPSGYRLETTDEYVEIKKLKNI